MLTEIVVLESIGASIFLLAAFKRKPDSRTVTPESGRDVIEPGVAGSRMNASHEFPSG